MRCIHPTHSHGSGTDGDQFNDAHCAGLLRVDTCRGAPSARADRRHRDRRRADQRGRIVCDPGRRHADHPRQRDDAHADRGQCRLRAAADRADRPRAAPHLCRAPARQGGVAPACAHRHHVRAGGGDPRHHGRGGRFDHARRRPRPLVPDPHQDDHQLVAVDRRRLRPGERPQSAGHDAVDGLRPRPGALGLQPRPHRLSRTDDASRRSDETSPMPR